MRTGNWWYSLAGIALGLVVGFILANAIFRAELQNASLGNPSLGGLAQNQATGGQANADSSQDKLTVEELRQAVARADNNPNDLALQKEMGLSLYRYAALERQTDLLPDVIRLLKRAETKAADNDTELFVTLGDASFVLARETDAKKIPEARAYYQKALRIEPKNPDLLTDIGLSHLFAEPPAPATAVTHFEQALKFDANHERALENLTAAQIMLGKKDEAAANLKKLQQTNPQNPALSDLQIQLSQQTVNSTK